MVEQMLGHRFLLRLHRVHLTLEDSRAQVGDLYRWPGNMETYEFEPKAATIGQQMLGALGFLMPFYPTIARISATKASLSLSIKVLITNAWPPHTRSKYGGLGHSLAPIVRFSPR